MKDAEPRTLLAFSAGFSSSAGLATSFLGGGGSSTSFSAVSACCLETGAQCQTVLTRCTYTCCKLSAIPDS